MKNYLTSLDLSGNANLGYLNADGNRLDITLDSSNGFDLSALPGFDLAKASDWEGCTRTGSVLTFSKQEATYQYATGYAGESEEESLQSVLFTLVADREPSVEPDPDPDPDPDVANEDANVSQGRVYARDRILYTEGISGEVSVFSAVGRLVYQGKDTRIPLREAGVYLVRNNGRVWKILVM